MPPQPKLTTTAMTDKNFIFVGGLHRSGTSFLAHLLANSKEVSSFPETDFPENEGQYLQSLLLREEDSLGVCAFGYHPDAHMDESHALATEEKATTLYASWKPYWDMSKSFLLEKTPKNLLRTRFLQKLFPRSTFIMIMRHPLAVFLATMNWDYTTAFSQIAHWLHCYERFLADSMYLNKVYLVRYEDLMEKPKDMLGDMMEYIGLPQIQYQDCFFPLLSELRPLCRENTLRKLESILGRVVVLETKEGSEKSMIKEVVKERDENGDCLFGLLLGNGKRVQITLKKEKRRLIGINIDNTVIKEITHQNSQTSLRIAALLGYEQILFIGENTEELVAPPVFTKAVPPFNVHNDYAASAGGISCYDELGLYHGVFADSALATLL